jgi:hypothetical protein
MGDERYEFMCDLLALCKKHGVTGASAAALDTVATRRPGSGFWISTITISEDGGVAVAYWGGERHEVGAP